MKCKWIFAEIQTEEKQDLYLVANVDRADNWDKFYKGCLGMEDRATPKENEQHLI